MNKSTFFNQLIIKMSENLEETKSELANMEIEETINNEDEQQEISEIKTTEGKNNNQTVKLD